MPQMVRRWAWMTKTMTMTTALALVGAAVGVTVVVSGQTAGQPSTKNGEWPAYTGDIRGSRYVPLDQINGSNFGKLEVAMPSMTEPCTWLMAPVGLMIWRPMSTATQTFSTLILLLPSTRTCATSAK